MSDRFEDHRGVIQDLLGEMDGVTEIFTRKGAIRGNHIHAKTTQWTYVVSGSLRAVMDNGGWKSERICPPRTLIEEPPGKAHAWEALEDTVVLVFSKGPRTGENYESDTTRLSEQDRLL